MSLNSVIKSFRRKIATSETGEVKVDCSDLELLIITCEKQFSKIDKLELQTIPMLKGELISCKKEAERYNQLFERALEDVIKTDRRKPKNEHRGIK